MLECWRVEKSLRVYGTKYPAHRVSDTPNRRVMGRPKGQSGISASRDSVHACVYPRNIMMKQSSSPTTGGHRFVHSVFAIALVGMYSVVRRQCEIGSRASDEPAHMR